MSQSKPSRRHFLQLSASTCGVAALISPDVAQSALANPLRFSQIAKGVFVAEGRYELNSSGNCGFIANVSFVVGSEGVAVIDTGGSAAVGAAVLTAVTLQTDRPIRYIINTHMHPDHILGNASLLGAQTQVVGHAKLQRALFARGDRYLQRTLQEIGPEAFAGTRVVPPTLLVDTTTTLSLGDRTLTLTARKTAHTDNDLTVRDEKTGTVFLGDLLFSQHIPTLDGSIKGWLQVLADLKLETADRVVPGHGPVSMDWPEAMTAEKAYLDTIIADVRAALKGGQTLSDAMTTAAISEKSRWLLADEFHARNVAAAFAELEWE